MFWAVLGVFVAALVVGMIAKEIAVFFVSWDMDGVADAFGIGLMAGLVTLVLGLLWVT